MGRWQRAAKLAAACGMAGMVAGTASALRAQQQPVQSEAAVNVPIPLPERNPARIEPPLPPHPRDIEMPDWTAREIQAALDLCAMMLDDTGAIYKRLAPIREGQCGTPAPIELSAIGKSSSVAIVPPARVTCGMAATLNAWSDTILQQAGQKHLGSRIKAIRNVASYVCRNRYNAPGKRVSEHARANALDMAAFQTETGKWITVLDHWALPPGLRPDTDVEPEASATPHPSGKTAVLQDAPERAAPRNPEPAPKEIEREPEFASESAFLYEVHTGGCALFGTVLGPEANDAHKDHFHYDLAERKHTNFCE